MEVVNKELENLFTTFSENEQILQIYFNSIKGLNTNLSLLYSFSKSLNNINIEDKKKLLIIIKDLIETKKELQKYGDATILLRKEEHENMDRFVIESMETNDQIHIQLQRAIKGTTEQKNPIIQFSDKLEKIKMDFELGQIEQIDFIKRFNIIIKQMKETPSPHNYYVQKLKELHTRIEEYISMNSINNEDNSTPNGSVLIYDLKEKEENKNNINVPNFNDSVKFPEEQNMNGVLHYTPFST